MILKSIYIYIERERECLVAGLVADDDEDGAMAGFDAIFDEGSDALINFLPHSLSLSLVCFCLCLG